MNGNTVDYVGMGRRIRAARKRKKKTQQQFAEQIGVSTSYIGHIERGIKRCSLETLAHICRVTESDANEMIFGVAAMSSKENRKIICAYLETQLSELSEE